MTALINGLRNRDEPECSAPGAVAGIDAGRRTTGTPESYVVGAAGIRAPRWTRRDQDGMREEAGCSE